MSRTCHRTQHVGRVTQRVMLGVDVGPHGERRGGVPELGRDHRGRHALQAHQGAACVAGVVQPDPPRIRPCGELVPPVGDRVRVQALADLVDHDLPAVDVQRPGFELFGGLAALRPTEHADERVGQRKRAFAGRGLRCGRHSGTVDP
jgi:hypothetical protein